MPWLRISAASDERRPARYAAENLRSKGTAALPSQKSLDELNYRRSGLFIALGIIIVALTALAMKVRCGSGDDHHTSL